MEHVCVFQHRVFSLILLFMVVFLVVAGSLMRNAGITDVAAQASEQAPQPVPNLQYENRTVYISLWLINIYSFDYKTGSYTFDFYVAFFWTDTNISTANWYLMNGYQTYAGAKLLVASDYTDQIKYEFYRVRANLNTPLQPKNYPFDKIKLDIGIELLTNNYVSSLVWVPSSTGIDSGFENVGWSQPTFQLTSAPTNYPLNIQLPRADMYIIEQRNTYGAVIETIVPPLIFCIVSAVSFLFQMHKSSAFSLRVGITTSMLITAVLFNIAQQNNIPPLTALTFYDVFIDSVIAFLAVSLIVNILGYVQWMRTQDKEKVNKLNKYGFIISVAIPIILFLILFSIK